MSDNGPRSVPRFPLALDRLAGASATSPVGSRVHRPGTPTPRSDGLGLDSATVRQRLVERIRAAGGCHDAVAGAMQQVLRHRFVDSALATQAYEDTSLPIGLGQTISKPSVVARMLSIALDGDGARARGNLGRSLEIGTGCGYQTALLGLLSKRVISIERLKALHDKARDNLGAARPGDIRLVYADGRLGHAPNAPYDSIVAAAGGDDLPPAWLEQLADGGRLVAPILRAGGAGQALLVVDRRGTTLQRSLHEAVHFVPLKSGLA